VANSRQLSGVLSAPSAIVSFPVRLLNDWMIDSSSQGFSSTTWHAYTRLIRHQRDNA